MSSGTSNPGDNVAEPGSSPLNQLYRQAIPSLPLFAFKAITELYLYPLHAQYYLVMYCTICNTKNLWNQFQKKALLHSVQYTLPCDKKKAITKYLGLWYSGLQHCVIRHLLANVSKELPPSSRSTITLHNGAAGSSETILHGVHNPVALCN